MPHTAVHEQFMEDAYYEQTMQGFPKFSADGCVVQLSMRY